MTHVKALPPLPEFLALPDYSQGLPKYFVEPEIVDSLVNDLAELVAKRVAELRLERANRHMIECRVRLLQASKGERQATPQERLRTHLNDFIVGASLVIKPLPKRKVKRLHSDYEALRTDWLSAASDAGKVWNTMLYCLQPLTKNISDDTAPERARRRKNPLAADQ